VHEHLRPERLAKLCLSAQPRIAVAVDEGRVLQALRPDAEDDRAVLVGSELGTRGKSLLGKHDPRLTDHDLKGCTGA
jgi:hypothetical protein